MSPPSRRLAEGGGSLADATEDDPAQLWRRLRDRKVVQWTIAYVAGAWALLQALAFAAGNYGWPPIITQVAMLGLALGLAGRGLSVAADPAR